MQLTSLAFYGFFAVVFLLYWRTKPSHRWGVALCASTLFYTLFGVPSLCVLTLCIIGSYFGAQFLEKNRHSRASLALAMAIALLPLVFFKYFNTAFDALSPENEFSLFVPVGISFFSFKIIAYLVEVWRGNLAPQTHFGKYALYVSFFPQVSSGPIQRPADLLCQIDADRTFCATRATQSAQLVLWGLFQKLVVADNLTYYISEGFSKPNLVIGPSLILAAVLYSVRLYADFAGYSNIAIGCMGLLGFETPDNFKSPYTSRSVKEFWNRWHISLSGFLRDYVYIPLGGSRCSTVRRCINVMVTFCISGLWHGTGIQFIVWGALHGLYLVVGSLTLSIRKKAWQLVGLSQENIVVKTAQTLCTFTLVTIAWVFFGSDSLPHALTIFARMTDSIALNVQTLKNAVVMLGFSSQMLVRTVIACGLLATVDVCTKSCGFTAWLSARKRSVQVVFCYVLVLLVLFWAPAQGGGFIYFQF